MADIYLLKSEKSVALAMPKIRDANGNDKSIMVFSVGDALEWQIPLY